MYLRCIEIQEKALGPDHQEVAQTLTNRAIHLKKQVRWVYFARTWALISSLQCTSDHEALATRSSRLS